MQVISVRHVGCKKGYPYLAAGLYVARARQRDGRLTYRFAGNVSGWHRTERACLRELEGRELPPVVNGVRHGTPVPEAPPVALAK